MKRWPLIVGFVLLAALTLSPNAAQTEMTDRDYWPTDGWQTSTPEAQGMSSEELAAFFTQWTQEHFRVDSMMIVRHGYIVAEAYSPLHTSETTHESYSYAKAVTGTLIGALLQDGLLESVDTPVVSLFPDRTIANLDERKQAMTVRDLLLMAPGLDANDLAVDTQGLQATPTGQLMIASDDWLQFALDLPMASDPGKVWNYNNAFTYILSGIITELTDMTALDYASEKLFAPLGIAKPVWFDSPDGLTFGYAGLQLTPRDMAKIGYLYLNHGMWDGQQIIPVEYADAALANQIRTPWPDSVFGYQFWRFESLNASFALGHGGQYIMLFPDKDMMLIATGGMDELFRFLFQAAPMAAAASGLTTADEALPENADGVSALEAVLAAVHTQTAQPVPPLPAMAQQISSVPYFIFPPNLLKPGGFVTGYEGFAGESLAVDMAMIVFNDTAEATVTLHFDDAEVMAFPVGLDDVYRTSEGRMGLMGAKGAWMDDTTFRLYLRLVHPGMLFRVDFNYIPGGLDGYTYELHSGQGTSFKGMAGG